MEERGVSSNGGDITAAVSEAPSSFHVALRSDDSTQTPGSAQPIAVVPIQSPPPTAGDAGALPLKKKRGRPRKYAPDGSVNLPPSPKPISSSTPAPAIDFSSQKRGKVRSAGSLRKPKFQVDNLGESVGCSVGGNFTPHIITVNAGEDVTMKVISFSQLQGPRAICIITANGVISSVTFRQPDSSGGTLTYEGRFEILSLSGSFMPSETGGTRSRSGGMSVSLASPDGRVVGGGLAGLLVAASPVQIVVGSFLTENQHEQKPDKKQKNESLSTPSIVSTADFNENSSFLGVHSDNNYNWSSSIPQQDARNKPADINISFRDSNCNT